MNTAGIKKLLLLVSADKVASGSLVKLLETNGYNLSVAATVTSALSEIRRHSPMLILVDREILAKEAGHRDQFPPAIPIIVLQPFDKSCGPDDCLTELEDGYDLVFCSPHYRELLAHIRAILRRHNMTSESPSVLRVQGLAMDTARHEVTVGGALVELTPKEFRILHQFLLSPGVVLSRQDLLNRVWGEDYALEEHALDVHIHSLRQKIEADPAKPIFIVTIRGVGYKLQSP
ncbi:MAG: response regulator transcription factor [Nitrospira sp.]|nr:response regulator transcription factor [Nitrospira sp.]